MLLDTKTINALWWESRNWGDALNPVLIRYLSGRTPVLVRNDTKNLLNEPVYTVVGSILQWPILRRKKILKNTIIWGTGFIAESGTLRGKPRQICAVRGPLTRDNLLKTGISCPEIYGDPALLYPAIYRPDIPRKWRLGIIPHYEDKEEIHFLNPDTYPDICVIDIEAPVNTVVDQICSCSNIASSSLHGIILADAYNIPSVYLKFSEKVIGDGFKFRDYFASVGRSDTDPLVVSGQTKPDDILERVSHEGIDIDLRALLDACPFNSMDRRLY